MLTIRKGDLIYIPQDVDMWHVKENTSNVNYFKTDKPITAVFLEMEAFNTCIVFANGQERAVALKCIYPMEERC